MKQPIKKNAKTTKPKSTGVKKGNSDVKIKRKGKVKPKYGTSKLERDFAVEYLEKNGIKYIYQYEAKEIGRYFDFAIPLLQEQDYVTEERDGLVSVSDKVLQNIPISFIIEIDGSYHHSDPRIVDESKLNPMQKHNRMVDGIKDKWCAMHCIPILRIWEYDIRKDKKKVMEALKNYIGLSDSAARTYRDKKKPH